MYKLKYLATIIFFFCIVFQLSSQDIKSSTKGFSVNLGGVYGTWSSESVFIGSLDDLEPSGLGFSAKVAYGINQNIEGFVSYSRTGYSKEFEWDSYNLTAFTLGGRFNFGATLRPFRPFVEAAISFNSLTVDPITFDGFQLYKLESSGIGGTFGGGIQYFVLEYLSINANGRISFGNYSSTSLSGTDVNNLEENLDFTIMTIHIGVTYFFE